MESRIPLAYTFGNHQHWVDMQWLWGYDVLPDSVADMLTLCRTVGVKGCVNFEGVGYEKMAAECPEALASLREAVQNGWLEVVGCSYGQPYGQFHGGESNVRQRVYGARTVRRLLGVWPTTFWEEEFDFYPQLPQILKGCAFQAASLFFQWTWHTPEIPFEDSPVIRWVGADGTAIPAATRNRLNLHQWPEDMDIVLQELAESPAQEGPPRLVLQWLELNPSPDWMCRSELILPKLKRLLSDPRFDVKPTTLGEYVRAYTAEVGGEAALPARRYRPDDVWHGLTLGKNGDEIRRMSRKVESQILEAESLAATTSLFGRPYAQWDVYPTWELEEAWREILQAQHHDNDECEGLCGRVGWASYHRAKTMAQDLLDLHWSNLEDRIAAPEGQRVVLNPTGWTRECAVGRPDGGPALAVEGLRAFGWKAVPGPEDSAPEETGEPDDDLAGEGVTVTLPDGLPGELRAEGWSAALLESPLLQVVGKVDGKRVTWKPDVSGAGRQAAHRYWSLASELDADQASASGSIAMSPDGKAAMISIGLHPLNGGEPDPGLGGAWRWPVRPNFEVAHVYADTPYAVEEIATGSRGKRKYPEGDWMTSPQWFEDVEGAFTGQTFVDLVGADGRGLLVVHDGLRQWFRTENGFEVVLGALDPWDEKQATAEFEAAFFLIPHGPITHAERWKRAQEVLREPRVLEAAGDDGDIPSEFAPVHVSAPGVAATAFYREMESFSGRDVPDYAGKGIGYPFVLRLVEFAGEPADVELTLAGPVAAAFKTNLLGTIEETLKAEPGETARLSPDAAALERFGIRAEKVRFAMRPHEIATVYLDLVPGRKQVRDLDARRTVWATVHRVDEE
ncbi:MAG: glycosyl hydrolase-related protein [Fimbriimonadaceae bacterium]